MNISKLNTKKRYENLKNGLMRVSPKQRVLNEASEIADVILSKEDKYAKMSDLELKNLSYRMIDKIAEGDNLDNYLIDGIAIAREMIFRVYNQKAFKVQIIGAIVAHFGDFAEMATGEGKTLTLLLVSYVNALTKKGVHIVTVNEYLVERDAEFSRKALSPLGISVGFIKASMKPQYKKEMYACDITYISNSELGFDYLRDNMVMSYDEKMQRPLNLAIIDEADSILVDEARTPLIIAGAPQENLEMYLEADDFVKSLTPADYIIDLESQAINLNDNGIVKCEQFFKIKNLYDVENSEIVHKVSNALRANFLMEIGREYIVRFNKEKKIKEIALVDSFTGRIMDGRMYSAGLHQAIQAKERVDIEPENITLATITYQSFFRLYNKLAGMSGTALTEKNEFLNIYNMIVVPIPTNQPLARIDHSDYIFATKHLKWKYVVADIKKRHELGQPILVGTVSVEDSELLHRLLTKLNIKHEVLNAKNNAMEAEIVRKAGEKGSVTIATNMAGRGTDIKLGEGVKEVGGLYVLATERHESRRIDNQLRGRSGRQGDIGESRFFISLQDSLFKRFASDNFNKAQYKLGEDVIDLRFFSRLLDRTQKRVENINFDIRKNLIDYDHVLSEQRELFYKQRDFVLLTNNVISIIFKMVPRVIEVLVSMHRNPENINMVDVLTVVNIIKEKYNVDLDLDITAITKQSATTIFDELTDKLKSVIYDKYKDYDADIVNKNWKEVIISIMDKNWSKYLDWIQKLRDSVTLRSFEQKSPLNIYIEDSDRLFYNTTITIANEVIAKILSNEQRDNATTIFGQHNFVPSNAGKLDFLNQTNDNKIKNSDNIISKKTINDIPISFSLQENDKINNSNLMENTMSNSNNKTNEQKIQDIVDQIFDESEAPIKSDPVLDQIVSEQESRMQSLQVPPPPPIPKPMDSESTKEFDIKTKIREINQDLDQESKNDFTNQVLNVVNNDIKPQYVNIDFEELEKTTVSPSIPSSFTPSVNKSISQEPSIINHDLEHKGFKREDEDQYDEFKPARSSYNPEPIKSQEDIEMLLMKKTLELEKEKFALIERTRNEQIDNLQKQIIELSQNVLVYQTARQEELKNMHIQENEELKNIYNKFLDVLSAQEEKEKQEELKKQEEAKRIAEEAAKPKTFKMAPSMISPYGSMPRTNSNFRPKIVLSSYLNQNDAHVDNQMNSINQAFDHKKK